MITAIREQCRQDAAVPLHETLLNEMSNDLEEAQDRIALLEDLTADLRSQVATLTAERDAEKRRGDNNHKMLMNSIRNKQS